MASGLEAARKTIETRIEQQWVEWDGSPRTPIEMPGRPFRPPAGGKWLQVHLLWGNAEAAAMGGLNEVIGVVNLNVFGPKDKGYGALLKLVDAARNMLNRVVVSGVRFGVPSGPDVVVSEAAYAQMNVSVPFSLDETA